jgi:tetratricopeptide (TPR) repeat protein
MKKFLLLVIGWALVGSGLAQVDEGSEPAVEKPLGGLGADIQVSGLEPPSEVGPMLTIKALSIPKHTVTLTNPKPFPLSALYTKEQIHTHQLRTKALELAGKHLHSRAVALLREALETDPKDRATRTVLASTLGQARQYTEAIALFKELLEEFPHDFRLNNNLAWLYATAEDVQYRDGRKALNYARKALLAAPLSHHVWSTVSEAYYVSGEYDKAKNAAVQAYLIYKENKADDIILQAGYEKQIEKCLRAAQALSILE